MIRPGPRLTIMLPAATLGAALVLALAAFPGAAAQSNDEGTDSHLELFSEEAFPSASDCAVCHETIYDEWRASSHAYASISPMFHKFEQAISDLAPTIGTFCVRCHAQVGTQMGEARELPLWERSEVAREGVTCITCHRVKQQYHKANGERHIEPGKIFDPVYGNQGGAALAEVIEDAKKYKVRTSEKGRGRRIHVAAIEFEQLSSSQFCVSCHQVAVNLGIKLEVVWDQYRASPAKREGISCQDCHMSKSPGEPADFAHGPAAVIGKKKINPDRERHDHTFAGPGYSIAHPGIFPHNPAAKKVVSDKYFIQEWLKFDYRAGWGTKEFERKVKKKEIEVDFPGAWKKAGKRKRAAKVITANLKKLDEKRELRRQVMENGSNLDGPFFKDPPAFGRDLRFAYRVTNANRGHNLPSGSLGAQPELWLNVALVSPSGKTVWESGYVDSIGDMADLHSMDVLQGRISHDDQLFNLQTKFLTTNVKGTDREMYLPVQFDIDQLPFLRPSPQPTTVINHPPLVRMESRSIPPGGQRMARYVVPAKLLAEPGIYRLAVRMRSRAEPIYFMRFVGATKEMEALMNQRILDIHPYTVEFQVR